MARLVLGTNKRFGVPSLFRKSSEPTPTGKYRLFDRIYTDTGLVIGTVYGFFTGAHDGSTNYTEYATVCLDSTYRTIGQKWLSSTKVIADLPVWNGVLAFDQDTFHETATFATDVLVANNSAAALYCRNFSFLIDGETYYGQLPNIHELADMFTHGGRLDSLDTTLTPSTMQYFYIQSPDSGNNIWSSTQTGSLYACAANNKSGNIFSSGYKTNGYMVFPILELPNQ